MKRRLQIISLVFGAVLLIYSGFLAVDAVKLWKDTPKPAAPPAPHDYVRRYPGGYSDRDYSAIELTDSAGDYVTGIVLDLWYAANAVYDPDDMVLFELGGQVRLREETPAFDELKNYDSVADGIFTAAGKTQAEAATIAGWTFFEKKDGKTYRMGPGGTGYSYGGALADIQSKEAVGDRLTVTVKYTEKFSSDYAFVDFTLVKQDGIWLVDDYVYPARDKID